MHVAATSKRRVDVKWQVISCSSASRRTGVLQIFGCWYVNVFENDVSSPLRSLAVFDGLLEENKASVVLGLLGDESLGVEMAKSC